MQYRLTLALLFVSLLLSKISLGAPNVRFGPAPGWVVTVKGNEQQPNPREVNDGYFLNLYEEEFNVEKDELYRHSTKTIVSDAGVQAVSSISINFNPSYEQLTVHKITVWRNGVALDKLQRDGFKVIANEEELSRFIYNGNFKAYLILKDIRKGDKIEYSYTISGSNPIFGHKFYNYFPFQGSDPIAQLHYCIIAPAARQLNFKYLNDAPKTVTTNNGNNVVYDWNLVNLKGYDYVENTPGWFNPVPHVQVSEYKSWNEVLEWAYKINTPQDKLGGTLGKRVAQLKTKYGSDEAAFFRAAVTMVQNEVRYMGVELGAYSHKANNPEVVFEQRYGDCKDKSLLLVSILRSVGMQAEMALVNSGSKGHIEADLPSPFSFNHAIVLAHVNGKEVWIDPTISYQGGKGANFYFPDYGRALVLTPGGTSLKAIPDMPGGDINYTEQYDVTSMKNAVSFKVVTNYSGSSADDMRMTLATQSKADLEKSYLEYYSKIYHQITATDTLMISDDPDANLLEITEQYSVGDFFEYDSATNKYSASLYAYHIRNELPQVGTKKVYPIAVNYPFSMHVNVLVNTPFEWDVARKSERISGDAYTFAYDASTHVQQLSLQYTFAFLKDHIAPGDIAKYEKDRKKMLDECLSYSFTYVPGNKSGNYSLSSSGSNDPNFMAILLAIVLIAGCTHLGMRLYKTRAENEMGIYMQPLAIGGWLILPLIGLFFSIIQRIYLIFSAGYFSNAVWQAYDGTKSVVPYKALLEVEYIANIIMLCYTIFCIILYVKQRDILPRLIKILYISSLIIVVSDSVLCYALFPSVGADYKEILKSVMAASIWVPYFSRATRVKDTFIRRYVR